MVGIKPFVRIFCVVVGILLNLATLNLLALAGASQPTTPSDLPYDIHLNWQHNPSTTMTVVWETTPSTTGSTVKYGPDTNYGQIATGTTDNQGTNGLIHIVEITGLTPNTMYHYICGDTLGGWSTDATFTTAPSGSTDFIFCSMGDSRDNPNEFSKIVGKANAINPMFMVFTGDLCGTDNNNDYDTWFSNWEQLGKHAPIAPALGNHEGAATNYLHRFALPNNERWYSFNYSNMHIIVLSTALDSYSQGTDQYTWFVNDLKAAANDSTHPWKIVSFHNPPYNVGGHGGDSGVQTYLSPLISQYNVDLVFNGHNHYYERTYPLKGGGSNPTVTNTNLHYYNNPDGVIYATVGSCGAPLYNVGSAYYLAVAVKNYNFAKIRVFTNNSLHMQAFLDDGTTLIDDFWIDKTIIPNRPPKPPTIRGPHQGIINNEYTFSLGNITDPDGDELYGFCDWGDGYTSGWLGPYNSGETANLSHAWSKPGTYTIYAKLKDSHGAESNWSEPFIIEIVQPDININLTGGFGIHSVITNKGTMNLTTVHWQIHVTGGILGLINKNVNGTVDLQAGESKTVSTGIILGLGSLRIDAQVAGVQKIATGTQLVILSIVKA